METLHKTTEVAFKLYIPQEFDADILSLVQQLELKVKHIEKKIDKIKRYITRTMDDFGWGQFPEQSVNDAWKQCVNKSESHVPKTLLEFWNHLLSEMMLTFKPSSTGDVNVQVTLEKLQIAVYTALTQSLFIQFADEKEILKCTEKLHEAISNPSLVHWDLIHKNAFKARFEGQKWTVFRPLLMDMFDGRLNTTLLLNIGFKEQDVVSALCADKECLWDLMNYEKLQDGILQELIGELLYAGKEYFVTSPGLYKDNKRCLFISHRYPHPSVFYFADEESLEKIKAGKFFEDDESLVQELLELQKKEEAPIIFKLFVSEKFKPKLFHLFNELYIDKYGNELKKERKRDILKQIFTRSASDSFGIQATKADISTEWERCLKVAESKNPATIFEFFDALSQEVNQTFQLRLQGSWGAPEKDRLLSFTLYTALVQSLFQQFTNEENLYKCTLKLNQVIRNHTVIFWDEIDTKDFNLRLKEQWYAFRPLMYNTCLNSSFSSLGLLNSMDMDLSDFTQAFFSERQYKAAHSEYPIEVIQNIAFRLDTNMFYKFRAINKFFYNALESNDILRKEHRLYMLSKDYLLKELIGKQVFFDNKYLLTDPINKHSSCHYRVTSMQAPYTTVSYAGNQPQFFPNILGGCVFEDSDKKINILTAHGNSLHFNIQRFKIDSLIPYGELLEFKVVYITVSDTHFANQREGMVISVDQDDVTVDVKFRRSLPDKVGYYLGSSGFFGKVEHGQAKFKMTNFDASEAVQVDGYILEPSKK